MNWLKENWFIGCMEKLNKLSLPVTILIASIILGGFYYASEVNKQKSIERQQEIKLQEERRIEANVENEKRDEAFQKTLCVSEAEQNAISLNKDSCARGEYCLKGDGMYLVKQYENAYNICLQRKGLQ
ncbi:MAG: hypothetical protein Q8Q33_01900 [Chlamydiota bacterium]|nr:hypothetical protein [Chlamydiota bacterium]